MLAAEARLRLHEERTGSRPAAAAGELRAISERDVDQRDRTPIGRPKANLRAAQAALQAAQLNLDYTQVRAPVAGRVGRLEITVGNLVAAGPGAPVLTTLVSVDPIYASFDADEQVVARALKALGSNAHMQVDRIPVQMGTATSNGTALDGHLQLIDNQVDAKSGTVRVRAVFDNAEGGADPGPVRAPAHGPAEDRAGAAGQRARDRHRPEQEVRASWSATTTRPPTAK